MAHQARKLWNHCSDDSGLQAFRKYTMMAYLTLSVYEAPDAAGPIKGKHASVTEFLTWDHSANLIKRQISSIR